MKPYLEVGVTPGFDKHQKQCDNEIGRQNISDVKLYVSTYPCMVDASIT